MFFTIINASLYLCLLYWYWRKHKTIDETFLLLAMWALVGFFGIFLVGSEPTRWKLQLWPFLYLFVSFLVFIQYLLRRKTHLFPINQFIQNNSVFLDIVNILYIICAIYELFNIDLVVLSFTYLSEEAQELYAAAHEDVELVKGPVFYAQRYTSAFFVLSAISVFNYLAQGKRFFGWILFCFILVSIVAGNAQIAARGVMMSQVVIFVSIFLLYRPYLSHRIKKSIGIGVLIAGSIVSAFLIAITIARFSNNSATTGYDSPLESVVEYLGHSMLTFDYGICDVDLKTWGGARTFNYFARLLFGIDFRALPDPGGHFGTAFTTFIGMLVQDFGYIGTIILGLAVSFIMYKMWSGKNRYTFAGMYIYVFYLNRMLMGVFVTPPGSDYTYAWAILTYIILRFIIKPVKGEEKMKIPFTATEKLYV